jgi:hypothetical protein
MVRDRRPYAAVRRSRRPPYYSCSPLPNSAGSRSKFAAIRRASSGVSTLACLASTSVSLSVEVGDQLSTGVTDDVAAGYRVGVPSCGKTAWRFCHSSCLFVDALKAVPAKS